MAFPPNYSQERSSRSRGKAQKALDKQQKREEKSSQRKTKPVSENQSTALKKPAGDQK